MGCQTNSRPATESEAKSPTAVATIDTANTIAVFDSSSVIGFFQEVSPFGPSLNQHELQRKFPKRPLRFKLEPTMMTLNATFMILHLIQTSILVFFRFFLLSIT